MYIQVDIHKHPLTDIETWIFVQSAYPRMCSIPCAFADVHRCLWISNMDYGFLN